VIGEQEGHNGPTSYDSQHAEKAETDRSI